MALFVLLIVGFFSLNNVYAQGAIEGIEDNLDKIGEINDILGDQSYLESEWTSYMQNSSLGRFLGDVSKAASLANPVFQFSFGVNFAYSWKFWLSFSFFVFLVAYLFAILNAGRFFVNSPAWSVGAFVISYLVISLIKVAFIFSKYFIILIGKLDNFFFEYIVAFLLCISLLSFSFFAMNFGRIFREMLTKSQVKRLGKEVKEGKKDVEKTKEELNQIKKEKEDKEEKERKKKEEEDEDKAIEEEARRDIEGMMDKE